MDSVGVLMIENENVVVAAAGRDRKFASLIRVGFDDVRVRKKKRTELVCAGLKIRSEVCVG